MYFLISIIISFSSIALANTEIQLQNNLGIQSYQKAEEAEKVRTGYLGRSFIPSLSLELGEEKFQTGIYQAYTNPYAALEARLNLFRGGRDTLETNIRDLQSKIGSFNLNLAYREELNKVRKLQWQIIHNVDLIKILEEERKENSQIKDHATRRAKSGVSTRSDILEFTIYDSELEEGIESLKHENEILKIALLPLMGLDSKSALDFSGSLEHEHDEELLKRLYSSKKHPNVSKLNAECESFENQKKNMKRWWTPALDLYGGYYLYTLRDRDYLSTEDRDDTVIGIRLTMELFDGLKSYNQGTSIHYQAESKRLMARHEERQTDAQFLMFQEDLKHTHEVMHYVEDRIKKSRDYLTLTLQEYDRGVKNSLDALTAMQRYYRYEKQYLDRKKEYQIIKTDLLKIAGE